MEVNITIFIQAFIFLMLFIFLSNVLFNPLKNLLRERRKHTLDEKLKIDLLYKEIKKQEIYIKEQTSLTLKKAQDLYKKCQQENIIKKKKCIEVIQIESKKKYKDMELEISNEIIFAKEQLNQKKCSIVLAICQKLYEN